jgi:hypothetical protein
MSTEKVIVETKPVNKEEQDEFLKAVAKSSNRKKILVHFKFKSSEKEFLEMLTRRQYEAFKTIDCLEFVELLRDF